jgi:hypothetical protein
LAAACITVADAMVTMVSTIEVPITVAVGTRIPQHEEDVHGQFGDREIDLQATSSSVAGILR